MLSVAVLPNPINNFGNRYLYYLYEEMPRVDLYGASLWSLLFKKTDVFHIHFPDHVLSVGIGMRMICRFLYLWTLLLLAAAKRTSVVWTVHNLRPHQPQPEILCAAFYRGLSLFLSGLVFHSEAMRYECLRMYPFLSDKKTVVIRHPVYPKTPIDHEASELLATLGVSNKRIVSILGFVRSNKNIVRAVEEFKRISLSGWVLLIAGECMDQRLNSHLEAVCKEIENIIYIPRFLSESEFDAAMLVSDLVAVPYGALHTSGVAIRALSLRCRVLALSSPEMNEIQLLVPSMVREVQSLDNFWLPLSKTNFDSWMNSSTSLALPEEFSPKFCQKKLVTFYYQFSLRTGPGL